MSMHISLTSLNPSLISIKLKPPLSICLLFFIQASQKRRVHPQEHTLNVCSLSYNNLHGFGPQCTTDIPLLMVINDSLLILKWYLIILSKHAIRDILGGPVVKTLHSQGGRGLSPWSVNQVPILKKKKKHAIELRGKERPSPSPCRTFEAATFPPQLRFMRFI